LNEIPKARVRSGSKPTLGSYHETHKGARPKTYWVAILRVGRTQSLYNGTYTVTTTHA